MATALCKPPATLTGVQRRCRLKLSDAARSSPSRLPAFPTPPLLPLHLIWQVSFEVSDATKRDFPDGTFDVVISRDTLLHIGNKPAIFKR